MIWKFSEFEKTLAFDIALATLAARPGEFLTLLGEAAVSMARERAKATRQSMPNATQMAVLGGVDRSFARTSTSFQTAWAGADVATIREREWVSRAFDDEQLVPRIILLGTEEEPLAWLELATVAVAAGSYRGGGLRETPVAGDISRGILFAVAALIA